VLAILRYVGVVSRAIIVRRVDRYSFTARDQLRLAKSLVIVEDISEIESCPKCGGILRWGKDELLEDAVSCVYCGWRPVARLVGWCETDV
jgi:predicted RNA-binding Zn-ribbon protein involved in translation (DUF1610 family)